MSPKIVLPLMLIGVCVIGLWLTRPGPPDHPTQTETDTETISPVSYPKVLHIAEHGITFGTAPTDDIYVRRENGKIRVEIRPQLMEELPETFLPALGWISPVNLVSEEGYREFLSALDALYHDHDSENHEEEHTGHSH